MSCPEIALEIRKGFHHDENSAVLNICKPRVKVEPVEGLAVCTLRFKIKWLPNEKSRFMIFFP